MRPRTERPSPGTSTSIAVTPIIGTIVLEEVARPVFWPNGPERNSCVPDSSQAINSGWLLRSVVEIETEKKELAVVVRPR